MSAESHAELQAWFDANKDTVECQLAIKHRQTMPAAVVAEWQARAPGDSDNEKELALIFALTQIANQLDTVQLLLANLKLEPAPTEPRLVAASHVDISSLAEASKEFPAKSEAPPAKSSIKPPRP